MQKEVLPQAARNVSSPMLENEDSMEAPPRSEMVTVIYYIAFQTNTLSQLKMVTLQGRG